MLFFVDYFITHQFKLYVSVRCYPILKKSQEIILKVTQNKFTRFFRRLKNKKLVLLKRTEYFKGLF